MSSPYSGYHKNAILLPQRSLEVPSSAEFSPVASSKPRDVSGNEIRNSPTQRLIWQRSLQNQSEPVYQRLQGRRVDAQVNEDHADHKRLGPTQPLARGP